MAEALLRAHVESFGSGVSVRSAGTTAWNASPPDEAMATMREMGLDISQHRPQQLTAELIEHADVVLGMTRDHLGRAINLAPGASDRAFLVPEFVRLAQRTEPRREGEDVRDWVRRIAAARSEHPVAGRAGDEVTDPLGEPIAVYRATAARLDADLREVARILTT
jgi:protein-tyrosine phosphatase